MADLYFKSSTIYWGFTCPMFTLQLHSLRLIACNVLGEIKMNVILTPKVLQADKFRAAINCSHPERTSLQRKKRTVW